MSKALALSYEQLRTVVLETLKTMPSSQLANLRQPLIETIVRLGFVQGDRAAESNREQLSGSDSGRVQSIIWDLIIEGVIRPGLNDGNNPNLPFYHVTEWGRRVLDGQGANPYDPDGYLTRLQRDIPSLDPVILTYLNESLRTLRINCVLSSTITLGCAAEKALLMLIAAYRDSLPQASAEKFRGNTEGRMIKRQFDELRKMIDSELRARLPLELQEGMDIELTALFDFIRIQRNDAGHPTGKVVEREQAYANLVVLPVYLRKVFGIIEWLKHG